MSMIAPSDIDPGEAFETLRAEVSLLRRAIEGLTAERQAAPDYTPTLEEISASLAAVTVWAQKVAEKPAMRLTPATLGQGIAMVAREARETDRRIISEAASRLDGQVARVTEIVRRDREAGQQSQLIRRVAAGSFVLGIMLWSFLPGTIARILPEQWHVPERIAARTIGADRWIAGQRMMASADPRRWQAIVDFAKAGSHAAARKLR